MKKILFDIETDGLLDVVTTVWCLVIKDLETGELRHYGPNYEDAADGTSPGIISGVRLLDQAECLAGHNIIDYDIPALRKLFPWAKLTPPVLRDTLIISQLCYPDIKAMDFGLCEKWGMPKQLIGRHGLKAWGYRLGLHKIDYTDWCKEQGFEPWAMWRQEMSDYCIGDVELNFRLFLALAKKRPPKRALDQEMAYKLIAVEMEHNGFPFDIEKAQKLYAELTQRRHDLTQEVAKLFDDWWAPVGEVTVTKTRKEKVPGEGFWRIREKGKTKKADLELLTWDGVVPGRNAYDAWKWHDAGEAVEFVPTLCHYDEGAVYTKIERRSFNPSSRDHIAERLQTIYGWKPVTFGKNGKPTLDDEILADLPFPPCKILAEYFMVLKRIGQLAEGKQAWLKKAKETERHGRMAVRIHGRMNTIGTVTFRCAHLDPNMGQVPSIENGDGIVPYGHECRDLFTPERGWVLAGVDASGLQLRGLAHNLSPYDGGLYASIVSTGDVHTANQEAAGLDTRARAKRFIYTYLFGGGGWKIGSVVGGVTPDELAGVEPGCRGWSTAVRHLDYIGLPVTLENVAITLKGFALKQRFTKRTEGLIELIDAIQAEAKANKAIVGLDGRMVPIRSPHAALNSKLMSDEAIICKEWKVLSHRELVSSGLRNGRDFLLHADVHDEWQMGFRPKIAEDGAKLLQANVVKAGLAFDYKCPLAGEFKIGATWAQTH